MNLDDLAYFQSVDRAGMLAHIEGFPGQLQAAWALGQSLPLPDLAGVTHVVLAGVGGSVTGGALLAALTAQECRIPFTLCRDYDLPAWVSGPQTLVIGASHTGRHEEALSAFRGAAARGPDYRRSAGRPGPRGWGRGLGIRLRWTAARRPGLHLRPAPGPVLPRRLDPGQDGGTDRRAGGAA